MADDSEKLNEELGKVISEFNKEKNVLAKLRKEFKRRGMKDDEFRAILRKKLDAFGFPEGHPLRSLMEREAIGDPADN